MPKLIYTPLDVEGNPISDVADPVNPQDAATKNYVDRAMASAAGAGEMPGWDEEPNVTPVIINAGGSGGAFGDLDGGAPDSVYGGVTAIDCGGVV